MTTQRTLLALALVAGAVAGVLYYAAVQRVSIVVAARDLDALRPLVADDLALRSLSADAVPAGALADTASAIGRLPRAPLWQGQVVLAAALRDDGVPFHSGVLTPIGLRAVALPVTAAQALGGAIAPGARVDIVAVPVLGRAPAGRTTELLASEALVLDVRGESGAPYTPAVAIRAGAFIANERIGSVVVAIAPAAELRFADRIATSTFVLAAVPAR